MSRRCCRRNYISYYHEHPFKLYEEWISWIFSCCMMTCGTFLNLHTHLPYTHKLTCNTGEDYPFSSQMCSTCLFIFLVMWGKSRKQCIRELLQLNWNHVSTLRFSTHMDINISNKFIMSVMHAFLGGFMLM